MTHSEGCTAKAGEFTRLFLSLNEKNRESASAILRALKFAQSVTNTARATEADLSNKSV